MYEFRVECRFKCGKKVWMEDNNSGPVRYTQCDCKGQKLHDELTHKTAELLSLPRQIENLKHELYLFILKIED